MSSRPQVPNLFGSLPKPVLFAPIILILLWMLSPFTIVPAGHRGVISTFGKVDEVVLGEGIHPRIPLVQNVSLVDVRIQKIETPSIAASRDLQTVNSVVALNFHIIPTEVAKVYRDIGPMIGERIINPAVQEVIKAITAQYTAEELISRRSEVKDKTSAMLSERLVRFGVAVDEFSITNFDFSKVFNEAIEAKTTADQLKLKAERDLERIRIEAEQKVATAKAEAESLRLQKQEVTAELLRLREIENQTKAIEKWDGKLPTFSGSGATPFISVQPTAR